jgi:hypothetical protein
VGCIYSDHSVPAHFAPSQVGGQVRLMGPSRMPDASRPALQGAEDLTLSDSSLG